MNVSIIHNVQERSLTQIIEDIKQLLCGAQPGHNTAANSHKPWQIIKRGQIKAQIQIIDLKMMNIPKRFVDIIIISLIFCLF